MGTSIMQWARRMMGFLCLAGTVALGGDPGRDDVSERVAQLVEQLGHSEYAMREAAERELDDIGEPALPALRKASYDADPEVRQRAERIAEGIVGRIRADVTRKALGELQGAWTLVSYDANGRRVKGEDESHLFRFDGDRWSIEVDGRVFQAGTVQLIEVEEKRNTIDLLILHGGAGEETARSIYKVEGDTLRYLFSGGPRAREFGTRPGDGRHYSVFRRTRPVVARPPNAPRPPEARFESLAFPGGVLLPETKATAHRFFLTCRPADGEAGVLTLDPTELTFDAFGDPAGEVVPARVVTLEFSLKLVKAEKGRRLFEIRGPRIVSRLSLVIYEDRLQFGDGRLLVRAEEGKLRSVIELIQSTPPELLPP